MSTNAIIPTRNLDINRVSFVVGKAQPGRNASISIKYDGQNISIRLPRLKFPGGVLARTDEKTGAISYSMFGSLTGCDAYGKERASDSDDMGRLYNFLQDLEEKIIQAAVENSSKWFGKKRSEEAIRDGFKTLMRLSVDKVEGEYVPNGKYPPSMTLKVPVYDNRVNVDIVDAKGNPVYVTPSSLANVFAKGTEANIAVSASIYVMAGGGFGVTWRISHAQVLQQSRVTAASVFSDTIEADEVATESEAQVSRTPPPELDTNRVVSLPIDAEIPDLDNEQEAVAPPPAPAGRKRRAVPSS